MLPWLKSDDKMPRNDKVWDLSDAAYRLMDAGRHYAAEKMTDGWVPASRISSLTPHPSTKKIIDELLRARLWHRLTDICQSCIDQRAQHRAAPLPRSGYIVHDYLHYNPSKAEWTSRSAANAANGRRGGLSRSGSLDESSSDSLSDSPSPYPVPRSPGFLSEKRGGLRPLSASVPKFVADLDA